MGSSVGEGWFCFASCLLEGIFPSPSHPICFPVCLQPSPSAASPPLGPRDVAEELCRGPGGFAELCGL